MTPRGRFDVARVSPEASAFGGELCGWALARGHARSGDPAELAGYLGDDRAFDEAIATFATAYADQNERDFAAFTAAISSGRIHADAGT